MWSTFGPYEGKLVRTPYGWLGKGETVLILVHLRVLPLFSVIDMYLVVCML